MIGRPTSVDGILEKEASDGGTSQTQSSTSHTLTSKPFVRATVLPQMAGLLDRVRARAAQNIANSA